MSQQMLILKPEVKLYRDLKKNIPSISWNRLEKRSLLGTPDILAYHLLTAPFLQSN